MRIESSVRSYLGPITSEYSQRGLNRYIKVAFSSQNVADFFVGMEVFLVKVFDHCGVFVAESLRRNFDLLLSSDTVKLLQLP